MACGYKVSSSTLLKLIKVEKKLFPFEEREVNVTEVIDPTDWWKPIIDYLSNPNQHVDRNLKYKSMKYVLLGGTLYKRFVDNNLLTCLGEQEAYLAIAEVHEGICGVTRGCRDLSNKITGSQTNL